MVYAPGMGTGYVSVGDYLDANQDTLARERDQINQGLSGQLGDAQLGADNVLALDATANATKATTPGDKTPPPVKDWTTAPGYADALGQTTAYNDQVAALGSHGGVSDYFQKHFGDTHAQGDFDASLLGYAPPPERFDLSRYLDAHRTDPFTPAPTPPSRVPSEDPSRNRKQR